MHEVMCPAGTRLSLLAGFRPCRDEQGYLFRQVSLHPEGGPAIADI
ncbi:MAG: hypothetical protein LRY75_04940 [Shewanella xiamenensis]|nr:hypothetical protein [Shewanella xiamenensis]